MGRIAHNGHLHVVVADFEERQCPIGHDGQERSRENERQYYNVNFIIISE